MGRGWAPAWAFAAVAAGLSGCGGSTLSSDFDAAARKQIALDNLTLDIFKRSPIVDAGNSGLRATDDLDLIERSAVSCVEVTDLHKAVANAHVNVFRSAADLDAGTFWDAAGEFLSVGTTTFQEMMSFCHANQVKKRALTLFPDVNFLLASNKVLPVTVYALEKGPVTGTVYNPGDKSIKLYRDQTSALPNFRIADEADTVYHEFGHAMQDAMNKTVLNNPIADFTDTYVDATTVNRDLDAIIEGLADLNAAAAARDEGILPWLTANLPSVSVSSRMGAAHRRGLLNTLAFPAGYVREGHMDGRLVASTMNDFRKFLAGQTVNVPVGCTTTCTAVKLGSGAVDDATAWDRALVLAYRAYAAMSTTTTYFGYALLLQDRCANDANVNSWCAASAVQTGLAQILESRGLRVAAHPTNNVTLTVGTAGTNEVVVAANLAPMPFPNAAGFANSNTTWEPCEVLLVFPAIQNNTATPLYDVTVELKSITNFKDVIGATSGSPVEAIESAATLYTAGQSLRKVMGFLGAGESSANFVNFNTGGTSYNSRWYDEKFGSYFAPKLSATYYPSELGFLMRAPISLTAATTGTAEFRVTGRRYNSSTTASTFTAVFSQTITTTIGGSSFCTN